VVNIADAFMRWTNDHWKSTPHRVVNPPLGTAGPTRRQSIPFFVNPSAETMIACLDAFAEGGARYEPITYADWIALKTRQAFGAG
jgi:isopenicillin N synthase-like dioxygenase